MYAARPDKVHLIREGKKKYGKNLPTFLMLVSNVKYVHFFSSNSQNICFINYETQKPLNCYFAAYAPYWIGEKSRSSGMKESWFNKIDDSVQKPVTKISFKKFIMKRCPFLRSSLD